MKRYKIGIMGAGRGADIAKNFMLLNCDIVALCDNNEERLQCGLKKLGKVPAYSDFDEFLNCEMDAVILANFFNEHTFFALKCFEKGIHVFCECISNGTMAEGVELYRAYKNTSSIFFLGENYPQMKFNREMQRVCKGGTLGKIVYAEGEYNHPIAIDDTGFLKACAYYPEHWRNHLPSSYYITHSLGPIMCATGATPKTVTALSSFVPIVGDVPTASCVGDNVAIITTKNDDGTIFRVTGCAGFGGHHNSYRICGTNGQIENLRGMDGKIMLRYNNWSIPKGMQEINCYDPEWNDKDEDFIKTSGHGGGDYITARMFLECIEEKRQPEHPFNLKAAIAMSSTAILAHRSMLEGGKPFAIPDFDNEEDCKLYENDRLSPFFDMDGSAPTLPCCSHTDFRPTDTQFKKYLQLLGLDNS